MKKTFPTYSLVNVPPAVRWAVTLFLATLGIGYFFGLLMVIEWVGLSPSAVAGAFRERDTEVAPGAPEVRERPIDLDEVFDADVHHQIDRLLLIQDTHVHVPVYALIAIVLAAIALGLPWPRHVDLVLVFALFAGPILDFAGQWLTKLVADGFAYVTLTGGWLMAGTYLIVAGNALWQMWFARDRRRSEV